MITRQFATSLAAFLLALSVPRSAVGASARSAAQEQRIEGRVLDRAGAPLPSVRVLLLPVGRRPAPPRETRTDERGEFVLVPGSKGMFRVRVVGPGQTAATETLPFVESFRLPPVRLIRLSGRDPRPVAVPTPLEPPWHRAEPRGHHDEEAAPRELGGQVVAADTGAPLADALIWQVGREERSTLSGPDGAFQLEVDGGIEVHLGALASGRLMTVRYVEDRAASLTLALTPGYPLIGRVVEPGGKAVEGARLELRAPGAPPVDPRSHTASDRGGRFRVCCLSAGGAALLEAAKDRYATERLELTSRSSGPAPVRLVMAPGRPVAGAILDPDGLAVPGARVLLRSESYRSVPPLVAETDRDGLYHLRGAPFGRYSLSAVAEGWPTATVPSVEVPPGAGEAVLGTLYLARGAEVHGEVMDLDEVPIDGAQIRARPSEMDGDTPPEERQATTGADGRFRVEGLPSGAVVDLEVTAGGHAPILLTRLAVPTEEPIRIVLEPGTQLGGVVIDDRGEPVADAVVLVAPREREGAVRRVTSTDREGRFDVEGVATGETEVVVTAEGYRQARQVVALDGETLPEELEIRLVRGGVVRGVVLAPSGEPVAEVLVEAVLSEPGTSRPARYRTTSSDGSGRFALEGLETGRWRLSAQTPGLRRAVQEHQVAGDDPGGDPVELRLGAGARVAGRALGVEGRPVAGVRVELVPVPTTRRAYPEFRPEAPPAAVTGPDGSFVLTGVGPGEHHLRGSHPEHGLSEAREPVWVDGPSVDGIVLYLEGGSTVGGRLTGLAFDDLHRVEVTAIGQDTGGGHRVVRGRVGADGTYRIPGLSLGLWSVVASIGDSGTAATATVEITVPHQELPLDLDLGGVPKDARPGDEGLTRRDPASLR